MLIKVIENMHDWKMIIAYKDEEKRLLIFIISITAGWQYQTKKKREEIVNIDNVEYWRWAWLQDDDINQRIICDGCQMNPIKGLRFKCLDCPDFDLCEECYNKEIHKHHKMKRITQFGKLHIGDNCSWTLD